MISQTGVASYRYSAALLLLALCHDPAQAVDNSPTARLTRLADCIGEAGDMKGARRESFMIACLAAKARAAGDPGTQQLLAPEAPKAAANTGLPSQERVLTCAAASKHMDGAQRTAYLKDCLAGRTPVSAAPNKRAERQSACLAEAQRHPAKTRLAFVDTCLAASSSAAVAETKSLPAAQERSDPRRRAACNVLAGDKQGKARDVFIEDCSAQGPVVSKVEASAVRSEVRAGPAARPTPRP